MKISLEAADGKKMTLDELAEFVESARANAIPGTAIIIYRPSFGSGLREVTVDSAKVRKTGEPRG